MEIHNILDVFESANKGVYKGTADKKSVRKRRAKNKMARKQRKVNNKK